MKKLFLQSGKLMIGEFPEEPKFDQKENVHFTAFGNAWKAYNAAVESAKASAVEVVNPEAILTWDDREVWFFEHRAMAQDKLYDLPSGWTVKDEYQFYSVMEEKWIYSLDQITPETSGRRRKIARLVPVIPPLTEAQRRALIDEGAPQKGIIITDNPEEVGQIYDFNQDVTGDKEYGTELSLVEFPSPRGSQDWRDVVTAFIMRVGNYMLKNTHSEHYPLWGKQLKQHVEEIRAWYSEIPVTEPVQESGEKPETETIEEQCERLLNEYSGGLSDADKKQIVEVALNTAGYALGFAFRACGLKTHIDGTVLIKDKHFNISFTPQEAVSPPSQAESQESVWKDVEFYCIDHRDQEFDYEEAQRRFTITRNTKP